MDILEGSGSRATKIEGILYDGGPPRGAGLRIKSQMGTAVLLAGQAFTISQAHERAY